MLNSLENIFQLQKLQKQRQRVYFLIMLFLQPANCHFLNFETAVIFERLKWELFIDSYISRQNCFGVSTFSAFSKGQKSTSKYWKTPETKKMRNKTFECSKLLLFFYALLRRKSASPEAILARKKISSKFNFLSSI